MAHLIDKSALVAEIERLRKNQRLDDRHGQGVLDGLHAIEKFLDTLEVKEVDLEEEFENEDLIDLYKTCEWIRKNYGEEAVFNFCKVMEE